tara:strand:+ start:446 stop:1108 length:663 start_codon:yes stop_codon:yes gene_type:complete
MAVPANGELSLKGIYLEITDTGYTSARAPSNASLIDASDGSIEALNLGNLVANRPNGSAPHGMTEFYAYAHDLTVPAWSSVIANQSLQAVVDPGQTGGVFSGALSCQLDNQITTLQVTANITGDTSVGTLQISLSADGDPGTGGTDNSATGYVTEGTTCTLSSADLGTTTSPTIHVRFKYIGAGSIPGGGSQITSTRTVTLNHNSGITDTFTVVGKTVSS